jgi:hypothetical protein
MLSTGRFENFDHLFKRTERAEEKESLKCPLKYNETYTAHKIS